MDVVVTGIGLVSALGSLETTWKHLLAGHSGIQQHRPFAELPPRPLALIDTEPARLETLTAAVVRAALQDAGLQPPLTDCSVVIGSSRGNQAQWERWAKQVKQRGHGFGNWFDTLPHAAATATARFIQTRATVLSPMAACATGLWSIAQAYELLQLRRCQRVLAGAIEAPITPLTITGFDKMGALASTGAYPFDREREGLVLGEGGAVLVLETAELARRRSAKVYGQVLGFGLTADGYHVSAPHPYGEAAIAAVQSCLERSRLVPQDIDFIHAHGTATQLNDRNEAYLIEQLFPPHVPVSSTKGATGHTIGASGAMGAAFCLLTLTQQILPPCVGLQHPEFDLHLVRTAQLATVQHTLCFSFGFGGQNAVLALGAVDA
ncbi:beta-ketoacyl-ACP synthase [Pantanalinema rosaneae CENA516]|uniref:beta-ketoacyl-ACP synthase n=1 Tax=Pantanalinema rosaneae TaxID=1620701 RepID=UPI003D6E9428